MSARLSSKANDVTRVGICELSETRRRHLGCRAIYETRYNAPTTPPPLALTGDGEERETKTDDCTREGESGTTDVRETTRRVLLSPSSRKRRIRVVKRETRALARGRTSRALTAFPPRGRTSIARARDRHGYESWPL